MRLFAGVELDERLRAACAATSRELDERLRRARSSLAVRWIAEQNLHITLWFFGEVADARAAAIGDRLRAVWRVPAFNLAISGVGLFPASGPVRIVWLGTGTGSDAMAALYQELTVRLAPLGLEPERRAYHPHLTIGRTKPTDGASRKARVILTGLDPQPGSCDVTHITLFQSRLSPHGARYDPLLRVPLMGC